MSDQFSARDFIDKFTVQLPPHLGLRTVYDPWLWPDFCMCEPEEIGVVTRNSGDTFRVKYTVKIDLKFA